MEGISVIMPSYLGEYAGSRSDSSLKFKRAVDSFLANTIENKELIIVSDGCEITNKIYDFYFKDLDNVRLIRAEKQTEVWPGALRECGRSLAKYDWITYLDSDDVYLNNHLGRILNETKNTEEKVIMTRAKAFPIYPWEEAIKMPMMMAFYDVPDEKSYEEKYGKYSVELPELKELGIDIDRWYIGIFTHFGATWQISHHKNIAARWQSQDSEGEDGNFVLNATKDGYHEIQNPGYLPCHHAYPHTRETVWDF